MVRVKQVSVKTLVDLPGLLIERGTENLPA